MNRKLFITIQMLLGLVLISLLCAGCTGNTNSSKNIKPPEIPPQSTFVMDFSDFVQNNLTYNNSPTNTFLLASFYPKKFSIVSNPNALGDRSNWVFAALNVGFWNLAGFVGLTIPVTAFVESIKQTPVKQPDGSWIWTYSITVQGITYTAELHGKYIDSGVRWDMYISKQNEYTDFLWYYGESNSGSTQGYWILNDKPSNPDDLLRIDWHRDPANGTGDIKYTNIVPGGPENGGYILFSVNKGEDLDRSYIIYNKGKNETTDIEWNSSAKAGRVKDSSHFGDSSWHYWNSTLDNTAGP